MEFGTPQEGVLSQVEVMHQKSLVRDFHMTKYGLIQNTVDISWRSRFIIWNNDVMYVSLAAKIVLAL